MLCREECSIPLMLFAPQDSTLEISSSRYVKDASAPSRLGEGFERSAPRTSTIFDCPQRPGNAPRLLTSVSADERPVAFSIEEITALIEDLMRIADELYGADDEVNAFLVDQVVNRLLDRAFGTGP